MAVCLHHSRSKGTVKLVLLGIANHDGDGGSWPTVRKLAKYANVHPRNVQKALVQLQSWGEIYVHPQAGGLANLADMERPNLYRILLRCPTTCDGSTQHRDSRERQLPLALGPVDNSSGHPLAGAPPPGGYATPPPGGDATPPGGASATQTTLTNHPLNTRADATGTTGAGPDMSTWPACAECAQSAVVCCRIPPHVSGHSYRPPAGWRDE